MIVGILSDIHANLPALERTLEKIEEYNVDKVVVAGDIIGIFGWPNEVLNKCLGFSDYIVYGNHDARVRSDHYYNPSFQSARAEDKFIENNLLEESRERLDELPRRIETDEIILAHSWPVEFQEGDTSIDGFKSNDFGVTPKQVTAAGPAANGKLVVLGHTHIQNKQCVDKFAGQSGMIMNPGSVGVPWNKPAEYAIADTETQEVELHSVEYDYSRVKDRCEEFGIRFVDTPPPPSLRYSGP